jgi:hypothetical protein
MSYGNLQAAELALATLEYQLLIDNVDIVNATRYKRSALGRVFDELSSAAAMLTGKFRLDISGVTLPLPEPSGTPSAMWTAFETRVEEADLRRVAGQAGRPAD